MDMNQTKILFWIIGLILLTRGYNEAFSQDISSKTIDVNFSNAKVLDVINYLQENSEANFSYSPSIVNLDFIVSICANNLTLKNILDKIFAHSDIDYQFFENIIVLKKKPQNLNKIIVKGRICDSETGKPLEYTGIQLMKSNKGAITEKNGVFRLIVNKKELSDSLLISTLGYERVYLPVKNFSGNTNRTIFLVRRTINIEEVSINLKDYKFKTIGNKIGISIGSIYIDTHGQQTALYIENKKKKQGEIVAVKYYLSRKGNLIAPFRVRIFEKDSITNAPGKDLLYEMLIIKPDNKRGWFTVDLSQYNLKLPEKGFFVGFQGIHPNDLNEGFKDVTKHSNPLNINYGQRLGFSRKKGNNTWHYSLSNNWFQLEKNNYNVMIKAEIQTKRKK